jgi:HK97 gp10 family phage protein
LSLDVSITVTGLTEAQDYFESAGNTLVEKVSDKLNDICQQIVDYARSIAPVKTGEYAASIGYEQTGPLSFTIFAGSDHAAYVEFGTSPHWIIPRNVSALHFEVEGEEVFAKYVMHPGTAPQLIIHNAKKLFIPQIVEAIKQGVEEAFSEGVAH